ncbi:hypothetical protein BV20DRAFT_154763 [Pilatotrama ljubarskyi]|nr:hypothetical protein BV20DRAFT_154763 [Pilatotrama ljubarskyi]
MAPALSCNSRGFRHKASTSQGISTCATSFSSSCSSYLFYILGIGLLTRTMKVKQLRRYTPMPASHPSQAPCDRLITEDLTDLERTLHGHYSAKAGVCIVRNSVHCRVCSCLAHRLFFAAIIAT